MNVFGISDLHLSSAKPKPMSVFGRNWNRHTERIERSWKDTVAESDIVLIPGDISWAMRLEQAMPDLEFIDSLPGKKVITKGNHDYWWDSITKLREANLSSIHFVQGNVVRLGRLAVTGTRLWNYPFILWEDSIEGSPLEEDVPVLPGQPVVNHPKIQKREMARFNRCLEEIQGFDDCLKIILTHFPPIGPDMKANVFSELLTRYSVDLCLFGHLHSVHTNAVVETVLGRVRYVLVSCDSLEFKPKLLYSL